MVRHREKLGDGAALVEAAVWTAEGVRAAEVEEQGETQQDDCSQSHGCVWRQVGEKVFESLQGKV